VSRRRAIAHWDIAKLLKTGLLVVAFALQGYLSEVHHHDLGAAGAASIATLAPAGDAGNSSPEPIDSDGHDLHCFICHLAGLGSASLLPPAILLALGPPRAAPFVAGEDAFDLRHVAAAYSSRAPPSRSVQG
jgi:hypothetical protein